MTALLERLGTKFLVGDGCWLWTAAKDPKGYGRSSRGGRTVLAHRLLYELLVGPIPGGLQLDHLCRNPSCVRPAHLEPVTNQENARRGGLARVTRCPQGHPYDKANTYRRPGTDSRECEICRRIRRDARPRKGPKTHCSQGHPWTPENTYERKDRPGQHQCRLCHIERARKRREQIHAEVFA